MYLKSQNSGGLTFLYPVHQTNEEISQVPPISRRPALEERANRAYCPICTLLRCLAVKTQGALNPNQPIEGPDKFAGTGKSWSNFSLKKTVCGKNGPHFSWGSSSRHSVDMCSSSEFGNTFFMAPPRVGFGGGQAGRLEQSRVVSRNLAWSPWLVCFTFDKLLATCRSTKYCFPLS